jgi:indolepyruvate ferredoxin oxidoreductase alpha subunit
LRGRVLEKPGKKVILLGNEAIVRGALESGVGFASTYPGTPASEIGDTFARIAKRAGIYFEYSVNEKVALEVAAGAAFSGVKSIVSMKHFGLNVASDSLMPIAYVGASPMVVVVADDPNCWSSAQSEQDSRWYARLAHIPMLEPSDPQEAKDFVKVAFDLSEKFEIPVLVRTTTRVSHMRGIVTLGKMIKGKTKGFFVKDLKKFYNLPPEIMEMHKRILEKIEKIRNFSEKSKINRILNGNVKSDVGIITSGVSFNYVMDSLKELDLKIPILKLSLTYPLPEEKIKNFIKKFKSVLVVEELDPVVEGEIHKLAKEVNPRLKIFGKNLLPKVGEFKIENVVYAISKITKKKLNFNFDAHSKKVKGLKIPKRFPVMCPGCPHRATFYAAKLAAEKNTVFGGDIGCYLLGIFPPLETQDFLLSMGASIGIVHGVKKVSDQKVISFLGDSTFFHAGMPGVLNTVFNKSNPLVIILDNRYTAMTGHQPHPGTGITGMGEETAHIEIDDVVKGLGIKNVKVIDPFNLKEMIKAVKEFLNKKETSVIVAKRECQLMVIRRKRKQGIPIPKFEINQNKCKKCGTCLYQFGCPAIYKAEDGSFHIEEDLCTGCGVCVQVCPNKAIKVKK